MNRKRIAGGLIFAAALVLDVYLIAMAVTYWIILYSGIAPPDNRWGVPLLLIFFAAFSGALTYVGWIWLRPNSAAKAAG